VAWLLGLLGAALALSLGTTLGLVLGGVLLIGAPTRGTPLRGGSGRAVLVLGLQVDRTRDPGVRELLQGIEVLVGRARAAGVPVVHVRTVHSTLATRLASGLLLGGRCLPGRPGTQHDPALAGVDEVVDTPVDDALWSDALVARLEQAGVGELVLVGLDGVGSVQRTARGALHRGLAVRVVPQLVGSARPARWRAVRAQLEGLGVHMVRPGEALSDETSGAGS
jgi:nicotinamidase-related amidase